MALEIVLICIAAAFSLFLFIALYVLMLNQINRAYAQAQREQEQRRELEERVRELEFANNYRMSYKTTREIENAAAINSRVIEIIETGLEFAKNTQFHLTLAHNPDEKKNGKTPK